MCCSCQPREGQKTKIQLSAHHRGRLLVSVFIVTLADHMKFCSCPLMVCLCSGAAECLQQLLHLVQLQT